MIADVNRNWKYYKDNAIQVAEMVYVIEIRIRIRNVHDFRKMFEKFNIKLITLGLYYS